MTRNAEGATPLPGMPATKQAEPRDILAAIYEGRPAGPFPLEEQAAAIQLSKAGVSVADVAQIMQQVEQDRYWSVRIQSAKRFLDYLGQLRGLLGPRGSAFRNYDVRPAATVQASRDLDSWGREVRFSSAQAREAFLASAARWRAKILAARADGHTEHGVFRAVIGADLDDGVMMQALDRAARVRPVIPARAAEPEPARAATDDVIDVLDEEVAF